ncbi:GH116 family glycosyl hydrolase [Agarivorans sp. 1_MG-2023]|uniref:GH116 family glycosyl hydrolase n=1 Tax=Agarivorans sp. 1_MG-2023 TaxID=3062634 RepID=UPI0026E3C503|nr:GH116 family glycosyl hydrolase [Agarivorans sp. 1_MG-2023]MDO6764874.1 GH116 family glycosyl hydrolase [Agarivorans sp. 1_MG-2023]
MLHRYTAQSSYFGQVSDLMSPGLADEFVQPWYVPLSTTPADTGIAVGGIGSAYTLTPAGTTPLFHMLPGLHLADSQRDGLRLEEFFLSQRDANEQQLVIVNHSNFQQKQKFFALSNHLQQPLFKADDDTEQQLAHLQNLIQEPDFYQWNLANLQRWNVELSDKTQQLLSNQVTGAALNISWLLDFYDGALGLKAAHQQALYGDWEASTYHGIDTCPSEQVNYQALYPVAKQQFVDQQAIQVTKFHYSPVVPNHEDWAALPVSYTRIVLRNQSQTRQAFSLIRCLENLSGFQAIKQRPGVQDSACKLVRGANGQTSQLHRWQNDAKHCAVEMSGNANPGIDFDGQSCLSVSAPTGCWVSAKPYFYTDNTANVVAGGLASGRLGESFDRGIYSGRELSSAALCISGELAPGEQVELCFSLVLDFPHIRLPGLTSLKKYTQQFPQSEGRALAICQHAIEIEPQLTASLAGVSEQLMPDDSLASLPLGPQGQTETRTLALNTLSFLAEATVWDADDKFLVRECADYPFFNSLDVYFYGSFSLLQCFPRLDGAVMRHFSQAVLAENSHIRRHHEYVGLPHADLPNDKTEGPRAVRGAVIHDLGSPFDAKPDAYDWHNVKEWKDLAPKYILMLLRHYRFHDDKTLLSDCWEACQAAMHYLQAMVEPGQCFPLTRGTDDTFDNLSSHGISVYCGSLWIASLEAYATIAELLNKTGIPQEYRYLASCARKQFHSSLWDEQAGYFHFYVTPLQIRDIKEQQLEALSDALKQSPFAGQLKLQSKPCSVELVERLNQWLNEPSLPELGDLAENVQQLWAEHCTPLSWPTTQGNPKTLRQIRKLALLALGDFWQSSWHAKLQLDSDDSFADQLLADSYCRMLQLPAIASEQQQRRSLAYVYRHNYQINSARVGAANLVTRLGEPKEWDNFQAHDVWIGVQYSLVTAMAALDMQQQAADLLSATYRNLYQDARIPFAAPEGFNASCRFNSKQFSHLKDGETEQLHQALIDLGLLYSDGRIAADIPRQFNEFKLRSAALCQQFQLNSQTLFYALHHTGLKYTAGRYFRPGMIFSLALVKPLTNAEQHSA